MAKNIRVTNRDSARKRKQHSQDWESTQAHPREETNLAEGNRLILEESPLSKRRLILQLVAKSPYIWPFVKFKIWPVVGALRGTWQLRYSLSLSLSLYIYIYIYPCCDYHAMCIDKQVIKDWQWNTENLKRVSGIYYHQ